MKLRLQALLAALVLLSFVAIAQPALASTSGGSGFARWVLLDDESHIQLNMSVPELITNETAITFRGNALNNHTASITIYVGIDINGTEAYSGAVTCAANNTTTSVSVSFLADTLSVGDDQYINITMLVGDNVTVDDYWNGTVNITTQFQVMTAWMIYVTISVVTIILIMVVVSAIVKTFKRWN